MKEKNHMSYFGVGPIYVILISCITIGAIYISRMSCFSIGKIDILKIPLLILGVLLIGFGITIWLYAVVLSQIDKNIEGNKLVTTGIYAYVRNPIYSSFSIVFTGILCLQNNLILFIVPFSYWLIMSTIVKKEEIVLVEMFGQEYLTYKSKVNCCIPWFSK